MKVSVNIVTRNRPVLLTRAIESVLAQDFDDYEIVVVDNSGIDAVTEHIGQFNNPKIKRIDCPTMSRGLIKARNMGLENSKGEYIAVLDDDDEFIDKSKLARQVAFLDGNPDYVLVGTDITVASPKGAILGKKEYPHSDSEIRQMLLVSNQFCHSTTMFRHKSVMAVGGYERVEGMWNTNEYKLWLKLGLAGKVQNLEMFGTRYTYWPNAYSFRHRVKLYWFDFGMARDFSKDYPNYRDAVKRYVFQYPLRYALRMRWWQKIDHS